MVYANCISADGSLGAHSDYPKKLGGKREIITDPTDGKPANLDQGYARGGL